MKQQIFFQVEENRDELTCLHKKSWTEFPRVQVSILCRGYQSPASSLKLLIHTTSITASYLNPRASSHQPSFIQTEDTPYWKRNQFSIYDKMLPLHPQLFISIITHLQENLLRTKQKEWKRRKLCSKIIIHDFINLYFPSENPHRLEKLQASGTTMQFGLIR